MALSFKLYKSESFLFLLSKMTIIGKLRKITSKALEVSKVNKSLVFHVESTLIPGTYHVYKIATLQRNTISLRCSEVTKCKTTCFIKHNFPMTCVNPDGRRKRYTFDDSITVQQLMTLSEWPEDIEHNHTHR